MAGNAQGEREDVDFTDVWEGGEDFFSEFFGRFQVVGVDDIQVDLSPKRSAMSSLMALVIVFFA